MEQLILKYFHLGLSYNEIRLHLLRQDNIDVNLPFLKRFLNSRGLFRKKYFSDLNDVVNFINGELKGSNRKVGYKWLHKICVKNGLVVTQNMVRLILKELDPDGVEKRIKKK